MSVHARKGCALAHYGPPPASHVYLKDGSTRGLLIHLNQGKLMRSGGETHQRQTLLPTATTATASAQAQHACLKMPVMMSVLQLMRAKL